MTEPAERAREARGGAGSVRWDAVALFYVLACAVSWPAFWFRDMHREAWLAWEVPAILKGWIPAFGPAVGAAAALIVFRRSHRRTVSLLGSSAPRSLAFLAVPLVLLVGIGTGGERPHLSGLVTAVSFVIYALGEEMGWRGVLQDALRPLPEPRRYVLVGLLWGAWHFTSFLGGGAAAALVRHSWLIPLWILGSWGIGKAVDQTGSLLVAALLHLIFNFLRHLPSSTALPVLTVSAVAWTILLHSWPAGEGVGSRDVEST